MTDRSHDREDMIAAALAGELDTRELRAFDDACATDPSLLREFRELQELTRRLDRAELDWMEVAPPAGLLDGVLTAVERDGAGLGTDGRKHAEGIGSGAGHPGQHPRGGTEDGRGAVADLTRHRDGAPGAYHSSPRSGSRRPASRRSRRVLTGCAAAAGLLVIGALGGSVITDALEAPPSGPAGTLGAVEELSFSTRPAGTSVDAAFVAHTWGTETVLEVDGLDVGESFEVVLVREDGTEYVSGAFLGSEQTITCNLNAAVLREDVVELQIRDDSGAAVATSEVEHI